MLKQLCLVQQGQDVWKSVNMHDDSAFIRQLQRVVQREWPLFKRFVNYRDRLARARAFVEIGSGLSIYSLLLGQLYPDITFYLVDRDQLLASIGQVFYSEQGQNFYHNSSTVADCITASQLPEKQFVFLDPSDAWPEQVDIVASFHSYCWHYGLAQYWSRVQDHLVPGGLLVLDVSQASQAEAVISQQFGEPAIRYSYDQHSLQDLIDSRFTWVRPH